MNNMQSLNIQNVFMTPRVKVFYQHDLSGLSDIEIQIEIDKWLDQEARYITQPPSSSLSNDGLSIVMTFLWYSQEDIEKLNEVWSKSVSAFLPDNGREVADHG
jgi:hypothetical protein